jgi:hypothetical protein
MTNHDAGRIDVLIVHHPTNNPARPMRYAAMGLISLADHLVRHGITAQVVNLAIELEADPAFDLIAYAGRCGARVIGVSVHWFFQLRDSLALVQKIKRRLPQTRVVLVPLDRDSDRLNLALLERRQLIAIH